MIKTLDKIEAVIRKGCYYVCYLGMVMIALMMVLMTVDAILGFFNARITGSYEVVQCMLCLLVFTSWAYTQTEHGHINVVMFVRLMHRIPRFICFAFTSILSFATITIGSVGVYKTIVENIANGEATGTLLIPYWPFYAFEFIAFVFLALALLLDAIKAVVAIFDEKTGDSVMQYWV